MVDVAFPFRLQELMLRDAARDGVSMSGESPRGGGR